MQTTQAQPQADQARRDGRLRCCSNCWRLGLRLSEDRRVILYFCLGDPRDRGSYGRPLEETDLARPTDCQGWVESPERIDRWTEPVFNSR